jgi:NitT/TauT family transport system permease protein
MTTFRSDVQTEPPVPASSGTSTLLVERRKKAAKRHHALLDKVRFLAAPLAILTGLAAWEIAARLELMNPLFLPEFTAVMRRLWPLLISGELNEDFAASAGPYFIGIALASTTGIVLGLAMGLIPIVNSALMPWVMIFNSIPRIALIPMIIVMLGIGNTMHFFVVFMTAVFPILLNVATGSATVDPHLKQMGKSFGAGSNLVIRKIVLPATVPFMIAGLRLALGRSLVGIIVAELFAARAGIGHRLFQYGDVFDTTGVYSMVIIIAAVGVVFNQGLAMLERRLSVWRTA